MEFKVVCDYALRSCQKFLAALFIMFVADKLFSLFKWYITNDQRFSVTRNALLFMGILKKNFSNGDGFDIL
ncbi:hypothetical protein [Halobacillus seohaensis]|uniref:Uncharacterized protein n=1 Tax=Halobacillus seohaensis TaxID=447421 RepID=A0ABW2EM77_9BACI